MFDTPDISYAHLSSLQVSPGGRTLNDCWLVSERSRVQTQGLQTLFLPISL